MTARQALVGIVEELRELMAPQQPHSATARCAMMALRGSYTVAELVFV